MGSEFGAIGEVVTARFRIVTPMFLGGANHEADEIRPASVKGMLRFWWRALNWSRFRLDAADDATALRKLHDEEARLFGSSAGDKSGGQGCFLMRVTSEKIKASQPDIVKFTPRHYMAGQGLVLQKDTSKNRLALDAGQTFGVSLRFRSNAEQSDRASVLSAIRIFGLLGGMGSRSRRGWGALALVSVEGCQAFHLPSTVEDYTEVIRGYLNGAAGAQPPFTAFSTQGKVVFTAIEQDAIKVIDKVGLQMGMYRGYGNKGNGAEHKTFGQKAEQNFADDHDLIQDAMSQSINRTPRRLIFGMPHNYFFSSTKKSLQIQKTSKKLERRASPLMVHVHQIGDKSIGVLLLLRSQFLPKDDRVEIGKSRVKMNEDWSVIEGLMKRPAFLSGGKA